MERSGFFNSVNGDRKYKSEDFANYFNKFITNGVFPNPSTNLQVMSGDGMNIILKGGPAWINGYVYENTSDLILPVDPADGVLNRIDRVVLRYDTINREIKAVVKKGTFAGFPVAPTLQRDADAYELGIADINVAKGTISITQAYITDIRLNTALCGIVNSLIQVDTTTLLNQYEAGMQAKEVQFTQDFNDWFSTIQDALDGDTAGNLLNLINDHKNDKNNPHGVTAAQVGAASATDLTTLQQEVETHKADTLYQTAGGTATAITLTGVVLEDGHPKTFIAAFTDNNTVKTINGKPFYKPGTTTSPSTVAGKAYTVWYNIAGECFFIKASAEGTATVAQVLAGVPFSNEIDTGLIGTLDLTNAIPSNIKKNINIGGVIGTLEEEILVSGDTIILQSVSTITVTSNVFVKCKEIQILRSGTIRVKHSTKIAEAISTMISRIYVNGIAVGTIRNNTNTSSTNYTEDIAVNKGDLIQVYGRVADAGYTGYVFSMYIQINPSGMGVPIA